MAKNTNSTASLLELVGSLLFLAAAFQVGGLTLGWLSTSSAIAPLVPLLWGVAVITAIALFFVSLGSFAWGWNEMGWGVVKKSMTVGAVALVALAGPAGSTIWVVLVGFVLAWLGGAAGMKK